jgi:hypothetical protein
MARSWTAERAVRERPFRTKGWVAGAGSGQAVRRRRVRLIAARVAEREQVVAARVLPRRRRRRDAAHVAGVRRRRHAFAAAHALFLVNTSHGRAADAAVLAAREGAVLVALVDGASAVGVRAAASEQREKKRGERQQRSAVREDHAGTIAQDARSVA